MKHRKFITFVTSFAIVLSSLALSGCGFTKGGNEKTVVRMLQYKPEAVKVFETIEQRFNEVHDDIELKIESPNEAMTILKTRLIKEDYPDIIGISGDINYSNFLDAELFMDIADFEGISDIKPSYLQIGKELEFIPQDGIYAIPYAANCGGILYNRDMFKQNGWVIPETWTEFINLCETIKSTTDINPLYFGYKDTWTILAAWNAIAGGVADADICAKVNAGKTTFSEGYSEVAEKLRILLDYGEPNPYAYGYNDACTAFARGESAMYIMGNYAVPQILSVNPDMDIDSFTFPANENEEDNVLNSGIDLQFSVMKECKNKEAAYEVLNFLYEDETIELYLNAQSAVSCKKGNFVLPSVLDGMREYIANDRMSDFHDHYYPSEMSVDALLQTYLMDTSENAKETFLARFDKEWKRYNRDLIDKVRKYEEGLK